MARRGGSKVGKKARRLKQKARARFIKATTRINVKSAKQAGREKLKAAKRRKR